MQGSTESKVQIVKKILIEKRIDKIPISLGSRLTPSSTSWRRVQYEPTTDGIREVWKQYMREGFFESNGNQMKELLKIRRIIKLWK